MPIEICTPTDEAWPAICRFDARSFGNSLTEAEIESLRNVHDMRRFRVAYVEREIVAVAGSYAMEVTLPGGASVPMGGVTWVATAATHRRQGLMSRVVGAVHDDIDRRGEPVASLFASEGSIYERIGYGVSTQIRVTSIDARAARLRSEFTQPTGSVTFLDEQDAAPALAEIWDRFRRQRAGETARTVADQQFRIDRRSPPERGQSPAIYLVHADGYAAYRMEQRWNDGHPAHRLHLLEIATSTLDAHAALWQTLLSIDLVGTITAQCLPLDDPLAYLLQNPRVLRTTELNDGVWVNVRDIRTAFSARSYRTAERIVIESDGRRWAIEGGPDGGSCTSVRTKPDLVTTHAGLSSLLYGGMLPSTLSAGRRMTGRGSDVVARADVFFTTSLLPHCQDRY